MGNHGKSALWQVVAFIEGEGRGWVRPFSAFASPVWRGALSKWMTVWDPGDKSRQEMLIGNHPREMVAEAMEMDEMAQER